MIHAQHVINTLKDRLIHPVLCMCEKDSELLKWIPLQYASFIDLYKIKMCNSLFHECFTQK